MNNFHYTQRSAGMESVFYDLNNENMTREEFQKQVSDRFQNTDSGFGNMTQRELILLQIASNLYESEVKKFRLGDGVGQSELLFAFIKAIKEEFADQNWDYLDFIADRVIGKQ